MAALFSLLKHTFRLAVIASALGVATCCPASDSPVDTRPVIRIGMLNFDSESSYRPERDNVLGMVTNYLSRSFPDYRIVEKRYTTPQLAEAVKNGDVEFFLGGSGFFVTMQPYGVRDIATLIAPGFPNPNSVAAGTIFVRKDRTDLDGIDSLKGTVASSTHPANFMTYQVNLGEIAGHGHDPDKFFKRTVFTDNSPVEVMRNVLSGTADVGMLRSCMIEGIAERYPEFRDKFRVIAAKPSQGCAFSTALYPGWTIAVVPHTNPEFTKQFANALLAMPETETDAGYTWAIATDFSKVNDLLRTLKVGPYEYLRTWTVKQFVIDMWPAFMLLLALTGAWIAHYFRVQSLVDKRTAELRLSMQREREAENKARLAGERLDALQRASSVGQLSSIFVHELGQPLTAMGYALRGANTLIERNRLQNKRPGDDEKLSECMGTIKKQLARTSEIIERVRSYAKKNTGREQRVDLCRVAKEIIEEIRISKRSPVRVDLETPQYPMIVEGNELELSIVILNLVKNAQEELAGLQKNTPVRVRIEHGEHPALFEIVVENDGGHIPHEVLSKLGTPFATTKSSGLGIGLMIVSTIAEAHGGHVSFASPAAGGLCATVTLPRFEDTSTARTTEGQTEFGDKF